MPEAQCKRGAHRVTAPGSKAPGSRHGLGDRHGWTAADAFVGSGRASGSAVRWAWSQAVVPGLTSGYQPPLEPDVTAHGGWDRGAPARVQAALAPALHRWRR